MADLIDRYLTTVLPQKQPGSIAVQRPQLRWWREHIGYMRLADVTPTVLAAQRDELGKTFAPKTVNRYLAVLSHLFEGCALFIM
jgi:hypothetical protein